MSRDQTFETIKKIVDNNDETLRIVVAGGDGSIMWVIECMIHFKIDVMKCVVIPLPLGTGNDFSNSLGLYYNILLLLGWGVNPPKSLVESNYWGLKKLITDW